MDFDGGAGLPFALSVGWAVKHYAVPQLLQRLSLSLHSRVERTQVLFSVCLVFWPHCSACGI